MGCNEINKPKDISLEASVFKKITKSIEYLLDIQETNFILYPFGEIGFKVKEILNVRYGIQESYIIDNGVSKYNKKIFSDIKLGELDLKNM